MKRQDKATKRRRLVRGIFITLLSILVLGTGALLSDGSKEDTRPTDVGIVLGNTVQNSGEPSARLKARLDRAAELYRAGAFRDVFVSGGLGDNGISEGETMRNYLVQRGIPAEHVFADSKGRNTFFTGLDAIRVAPAHGWRSATAVTHYYHLPRTRLTLKRFGFSPVRGGATRHFEWRDVYWSIPRELLGYAKYALRPYPS